MKEEGSDGGVAPDLPPQKQGLQATTWRVLPSLDLDFQRHLSSIFHVKTSFEEMRLERECCSIDLGHPS
jgi:hypothetical protein